MMTDEEREFWQYMVGTWTTAISIRSKNNYLSEEGILSNAISIADKAVEALRIRMEDEEYEALRKGDDED